MLYEQGYVLLFLSYITKNLRMTKYCLMQLMKSWSALDLHGRGSEINMIEKGFGMYMHLQGVLLLFNKKTHLCICCGWYL